VLAAFLIRLKTLKCQKPGCCARMLTCTALRAAQAQVTRSPTGMLRDRRGYGAAKSAQFRAKLILASPPIGGA
jgi:hypothetical protein